MAPAALRQDPAAIAAALERLPLPVFTLSDSGVITWLNERAREITGDAVGRRFTTMLAPESVPVGQAAFAQQAVGERTSSERDVVFLLPDGTRLAVEVSTSALQAEGRFIGVFGIFVPEEQLPPPTVPLRDLTPRQAEVLRHLARGCSTAQMSEEMGVSVDTVRNHIRDLLKRLGVHSRLEAVLVARQRGLL